MSDDDTNDPPTGNRRRNIMHAPEKFCFEQPAAWPDYIENFQRYLRISGYKPEENDEKIDVLLYHLGVKAITIFKTFSFDAATPKTFDNVVKKFGDYFEPKKNVIYHRCVFNKRSQLPNETAEHYIRELLTLAEACDYGNMKDELIRDRLVVGILDRKLAEELQLVAELTKQTAIEKIRAREQVHNQQASMSEPVTVHETHVDAIFKSKYKHATNKNQNTAGTSKDTQYVLKNCSFCGKNHKRGACPAYGKNCAICNKRNHFAQVCKNKTNNIKSVKQVSADSTSEEEEDLGDYFIGAVEKDKKTGHWRTTVQIKHESELDVLQQTWVSLKVDSGADVTVITPEQFKALKKKPTLRQAKRALFGPDGTKFHVVGYFRAKICLNNDYIEEYVYVVDNFHDNLLSRCAGEALGILIFNPKGRSPNNENSGTRVLNVNADWEPKTVFPSLFKGLGKMKTEYTIKLKDDAVPVAAAAPRRIPHPLRQKTKAKLDELEQLGVISKITEPTQWCGHLVVVPKPETGDIRLTVDSTALAKSVVRDRVILPSVEETLSKMAGAKVFSKLDCKDGFWQIPLSKDCRKLTTFVTPWGRYCYNRLFMGCTSASEYFHLHMCNILEGLEGCVIHIDDITVYGTNQVEHDERLYKVLSRLQDHGVTLNNRKCKFRVSQISLVGYIVSGEGSLPNPSKVSAINSLKHPKDKKELKSFLARLEFLRKFVPNMTEIIQPLSDLQREDISFIWDTQQKEAFSRIKKMLISSPVLTLYDPNKQHRILSDASNVGLGGSLEQLENNIWKPVTYISRRLTDAESRYATIEKEALGVTWACYKLEEYILGKEILILTDHKPLVSILGQKNLSDMSPRLQRMRMKLLRYNFKIEYIPGSEMCMPDILSRSPSALVEADKNFDSEIQNFICHITENLPISAVKLDEIKKAQLEDPVLIELLQYVKSGFPNSKDELSLGAKPFWQIHHELTQQEGLLLYRSRIVIPSSMRKHILNLLHEGHLGIVKTKLHARACIYWPGITRDIENVINACFNCAKVNVKCNNPLILQEAPDRPWGKVCLDIAEFEGKNYLVLTDTYSRFIEIKLLNNMTSNEIIIACKSIFARHGIPKKCFSDNGRQFISDEFRIFAKKYGFEHSTSSPHYPQSNGQAEAGVKVFKNIMKKCDDPYLGLLFYRATPIPDLGTSPAQLLMGRPINTTLPIISQNLKPSLMSKTLFTERNNIRRSRAKTNYDKHHRTKETTPLKSGERVWVSDLGRRGRVTTPVPGAPRSYYVETEKGVIRRNLQHLVPIHPTPNRISSPENRTVIKTPLNTQSALSNPPPIPPRGSVAMPPSPISPTFDVIPNTPTVTRSGRMIKQPKRLNL